MIKLSENIVNSLKYFVNSSYYKSTKPYIDKLLSLINNNNEIEISSEGIFDISIYRIEIDETGSRLNLYYKDKNNVDKVQKWKIGKFILLIYKSIFNEELKETITDDLVQMFIGIDGFKNFLKQNNLKIVIDYDFFKSYNSNNYINDKGSLGHSCVNNNEAVMCLYTLLSGALSIVRIEDSSGKIWGRSLLWKTDKGDYLDRFYITNNMYFSSFYLYMLEEYGIENNYINNYTSDFLVKISINDVLTNTKKLEKKYNTSYTNIVNNIVNTSDYKNIFIDTMKYLYITDGYKFNEKTIFITNQSKYNRLGYLYLEQLFFVTISTTTILLRYNEDNVTNINSLINLDEILTLDDVLLLKFLSLSNNLYCIYDYKNTLECYCYIGLLNVFENSNLFYLLYSFITDNIEASNWRVRNISIKDLEKEESDELISIIKKGIKSTSYDTIFYKNLEIEILNLKKQPMFFFIRARDFINFYGGLTKYEKENLKAIVHRRSSKNSKFLNNFYIALDPLYGEISLRVSFNASRDLVEEKLHSIKNNINLLFRKEEIIDYFKIYDDIELLYNDIYKLLYLKRNDKY